VGIDFVVFCCHLLLRVTLPSPHVAGPPSLRTGKELFVLPACQQAGCVLLFYLPLAMVVGRYTNNGEIVVICCVLLFPVVLHSIV
jgi:hypothetical protein